MSSKRPRLRPVAGLTLFAVVALLLVGGASAGVSSGSLAAPTGVSPTGDKYNPTHWKVAAGDTITGTITNASDAQVGSGGCNTTDGVLVTIQSSSFGNQPLCGTFDGVSTITFTWQVPSTGVCSTTVVSYNETGHMTNNSLITSGGNSVAGFAIVDSNGDLITTCDGKAAPQITTVPGGGGFTGDTLQDTATLTGSNAATGTITFDLYPPSDPLCQSTAVYEENVPVNGDGGYATTVGYVSLTTGTYNWIATYNGDANNTPATSACGEEAFVVAAAASTVLTTIEDSATDTAVGAHIPLGSSIHDKAVVTATDSPFVPQGTVDFHFYSSIDCGQAIPETPADELAVGLDVTGTAESTSKGPLGAGSYSYLDHYNSSDLNKWTDGDATCESVTVDKGNTTTVTAVKNAAGTTITTVPVGSSVHDSVTVGGAVTGIPLTGTVAYSFSTNGCTGPFTAFDTEPVGTNSKATGPLGPGNYAFQASYSGDSNYIGSAGVCEPFSVFNPPLTPGYWKTHQAQTTALLTANCIKLGNYGCVTWTQASAIFNGMNCSNTSGQNSIGCLAGHLLATKLNLANGSNTCISPAVARADSFLSHGTVDGVVGVTYVGPSGNLTLSAAQRAEAITLKNPLDSYNNGLGC